ncbi:MAG: (d)CMP kinase [Verrucomicrobiota bacterium]|jgi:cytidylate kinase
MPPPTPHIVIAIDGPAASGKSSVARALARRLKYRYVNTGAMYRAVTWLVVSRSIPPADTSAVRAMLDSTVFECGFDATGESTILLDGLDPAPHLNDASVTASVSTIASIPEVRRRLVALQRACCTEADVVMEGRDIGSAVFPETPYKFYIDATLEVRAARRQKQGVTDRIEARDKQDSSRPMSPLIIAEDAHVVDSSHLTIDGVVGEIIGRLKLKSLALPEGI